MVAKKSRVLIVGAGMAGLTTAHRLYTTAPDLFDLTIVDANHRIGGRIFTSEFAGDRVEMGATWIHGIGGSPVYDIACKIHALDDPKPWERMDGYPDDAVTVGEGGVVLDPAMVSSISTLYRTLMDTAKDGGLPASAGPSVGSFLRRGLQAYRGSNRGDVAAEAVEDAVFAMNENTERTYTSADDLEKLNLAAESEYREFPGEQITIAKGYSRVIEHLASVLPAGTIRLGRKVERIEWSPDGGGTTAEQPVKVVLEDGSEMAVDHVVVTVSLGVLKAKGGMEFNPSLPLFKREAIGRLGFGVVNKLFVEVEEGEVMPSMEMAFEKEKKKKKEEDEEGGMRHVAKIPWWMRRTASICPIYNGSRVGLAWFAGKEAMELEKLSDEEIKSGVQDTLDGFKMDRRSSVIERVKRSGWGSDPLFRGSYSYVTVGSSGDDLDLMAEPVPVNGGGEATGRVGPALQILFAGEATHRTHYSTTHGAYFSGIREANRLIQRYSN
ncbi:probable polyamine oxidase 5 [Dioscorea cayenensis subsp. rotundata]|uniref:Probable polyamine oxidase 5 n=1 Tax=Dioscorea cayennensis subsp. rotundata TaxID=55577 RepID=A0AB40CVX7_DIOCR|nr:probable polyamine oxidase 5 [Dioscorea cayenensis subsp. rotundata]